MSSTLMQSLLSWALGVTQKSAKPKRPAQKQKSKQVNQRRAAPNTQRPSAIQKQSPTVAFRSFEAFHGTPSVTNARSILRDGWMVGRGNANGDGVYLALDKPTAMPYATQSGVLVRCRVSGRCSDWNAGMDAAYSRWCSQKGVTPDNSAKTAFLLERGIQILRAGTVLIVLRPQFANPTAYKQKLSCIRILSMHKASDGKVVRV